MAHQAAGASAQGRFGLWALLPEIGRQKKLFADAYVASLLLHVVGLASPLFFQAVLDKVVVHGAKSTLIVLGIGVVCAIVLDAAISLAHSYLLLHANPKIDLKVSARVFRRALSLPLAFFERGQTGSLVRDMQQDRSVRDFFTGSLFFCVTELTALAVLLPLLFSYSASLTAVVLFFSALIAAVSAGLAAPFRNRLGALYAADSERQAHLVETVHGIATVKALGLEDARQRSWERLTAAALDRSREFHWLGTRARAATLVLEKLMAVAVVWVGASMVFEEAISIGQLVAFQMLAGRVTGPLMYLVSLTKSYQEAAVSARQLSRIMDAETEARRSCGLTPRIRGNLSFEEVGVTYEGSATAALDRVTLSIPAGTMLGVVGRSGSGKSTLARVVQGLLAPQRGTVLVDGHDIRDLDLHHLRRCIGVVPQEAFLFRGSVRDNIAASDPGAGIDDITSAAREAGADEFIRNLPRGYDTILEEGAVNLSGGQRQRLAIARALLRRPPILIFDEATSALDFETEAAVQRSMEEITKGRTTIVITHRLASLQAARSILVLDKGRVAGLGTHQQLLHSCAAYRQLWGSQPWPALQMAAE